jgi:hypothetical protein
MLMLGNGFIVDDNIVAQEATAPHTGEECFVETMPEKKLVDKIVELLKKVR